MFSLLNHLIKMEVPNNSLFICLAKVVGDNDPGRPSWANGGPTDYQFIPDHPATYAGKMMELIYNNTISAGTRIPAWTYGPLSNYSNITV